MLITLAGSGGTGKTTVVNALKDILEDKMHFHESIVRTFYMLRGVKSEVNYLAMTIEDRKKFQIELVQYYISELTLACSLIQDKIIICDRSVFDHIGYSLYGGGSVINFEDMSILHQQITAFRKLKPKVFYCPYPAPWTKGKKVEDEFRAVEPAKDTIIDAIIYRFIAKNRDIWENSLAHESVSDRCKTALKLFSPSPSE
jgi:predicted ATPase